MKKVFSLLLVLCLVMAGSTAWAKSINEQQARSIAEGFMANRALPSTSLQMATKAPRTSSPASDKAAYYVFNATRGGYVIVAGDDRAPAVLGYSDNGRFDAQDIPEALQYLLEGYAAQIESLDQGAKAMTQQPKAGPAISPLMAAAWRQDTPYNILLPTLSNGNHAVTGCAATAMAQVMHYWKWPARPTTTIPAYESSSLHIYMPELEPVDFDWDNMHDTYLTDDTTSTAAVAVATLNLYCAQALKMDFLYGSSAAVTSRILTLLPTYFGYKPSAHGLSRSNYTTHQWSDIIYNELKAGRPVIYSTSKKSGGHAFVCDGYDGNGMYHINWGWNGLTNGYFLLNVLNPDEQGTGGISGNYGYIYDQRIFVGIEPGNDGSIDVELTASNLVLHSMTTERPSTNEYFTAVVSGHFNNFTSQRQPVCMGWGLYDKDYVLVDNLFSSISSQGITPGNYIPHDFIELNFGEYLTSGTYRILPIFCEAGTDNWRPCAGTDINYIELTIDGNTCDYTGHGTFGANDFTVNAINIESTLHKGSPVNIGVDLTNDGLSQNTLLHMFINGAFNASGFVALGNGESGVIPYSFTPNATGVYTITFSFNDDGSDPIATRTITITEMPEANLSATVTPLNVTDAANHIITSNCFSAKFDITNNGTTPYNEQVSLKLYKRLYGGYASNVQVKSQMINLAPGETQTVQFDMDNVLNNWDYFIVLIYHSGNDTPTAGRTGFYTIVFPEVPQVVRGDVNGDNEIDISDATALINYLLYGDATDINLENANCDLQGGVDISDATILINFLLYGTW